MNALGLDLAPLLLLVVLSVVLASTAAILLTVHHTRHKRRRSAKHAESISFQFGPDFTQVCSLFSHRPSTWMAVKSRNVYAVQSALGLHNVKPCTWTEGMACDEKLFIAPPVNGWILVAGSCLPDPSDDVDACFRFLLDTSRKLGHVQFFSAVRVLGHHAWARAESGRIIRAYAWAGKTQWNQGVPTRAELELGMKCFDYLQAVERPLFHEPDAVAINTERVPLLAARWSFDPAAIDERVLEHAYGIAGEPSRLY